MCIIHTPAAYASAIARVSDNGAINVLNVDTNANLTIQYTGAHSITFTNSTTNDARGSILPLWIRQTSWDN